MKDSERNERESEPFTTQVYSARRVLLLHFEAASDQKGFCDNAVPFLTPPQFSHFQPLLEEGV